MNRDCSPAFRSHAATACVLALLFLSGCSLPRIIILNDPLSAEEHNNLGRIYESQEKFDLAAQQYREALKKDKKSVPALLLLGDLSFRTRNYAEAESAYKKAIKLEPGNGDSYNNLCWVYLEQHAGMEKAEELIRKAITMTPEHRAYYLDTLGVVLLRLGRTSESITALKEALELLPKDNASYLAEAYLHLAEAYRTAGDMASAGEAEQSAQKYRSPI
jgi:tetratricopeptide (TPR) repeat protein